jgi:hypothetical protein
MKITATETINYVCKDLDEFFKYHPKATVESIDERSVTGFCSKCNEPTFRDAIHACGDNKE